MSKILEAELMCPFCGNKYNWNLYRTIRGEDPKYRELVFSDKINVATCTTCGKSAKVGFPFLFVNAPEHFAVRREPEYDKGVDEDVEGYSKLWGNENFYVTAPRIRDWEEFKNTIIKFETGELKGKPITIEQMKNSFKIFNDLMGK